MSGKGSGRRPEQTPGAFSSGYDMIFTKKDKQKEELSQVKENEQPQTNETGRSG